MQFYNNQFVYDGNFRNFINYEALSTQENELEDSLKIFPNPVSSYIQIENQNKKLDFEIYNIVGEKILSGVLRIGEKVNINRLQSGQYILKTKSYKPEKQFFLFIKM